MAATPIPRNKAASLPNFSRYKFDPPAGSVLKYKEGQGYYTVPKPKGTVVRTSTPQDSFTTIETPAQIEQRVKRMTEATFAAQQTSLESAADKLKKEAEQRRVSLQGAYEAAARANAAMGTGAQATWNTAASTLQGLASTASGGVADALQRDLATQEEALARVGAGGTGFDARSQAGVESYRGGFLPAEMFTRQGALQKNYLEDQAKALNLRGVQEGIASEGSERYKINADLQSQINELGAGRSKYEQDLRSQLLGARGDQLKLVADQEIADKKIAFDYYKQKTYLDGKAAELEASYQRALLTAGTAAQKLAVDKWYKANKLTIDTAKTNAYVIAQDALAKYRGAQTVKTQAGPTSATGPIPATWPAAWNQFSTKLDTVLNGKDPRFFVKDASGAWNLKAKYTAGNNAKLLRDDLMRLVGAPYVTKFGAKRVSSLRARAYAKAFAVFKIYKSTDTAKGSGSGLGVPSL